MPKSYTPQDALPTLPIQCPADGEMWSHFTVFQNAVQKGFDLAQYAVNRALEAKGLPRIMEAPFVIAEDGAAGPDYSWTGTSYDPLSGHASVTIPNCSAAQGDFLLITVSGQTTLNSMSTNGAKLALHVTEFGRSVAQVVGSEVLVNKNLTAGSWYEKFGVSVVWEVQNPGDAVVDLRGLVVHSGDTLTLSDSYSLSVARLRILP